MTVVPLKLGPSRSDPWVRELGPVLGASESRSRDRADIAFDISFRRVRIVPPPTPGRGLSQSALAELAGIPQPNLSAYERDRRCPSAETLNRLVMACGYQLAATD